MKKVLMAACIAAIVTGVYAGNIDNFKELEKRLTRGEQLRAFIHYDKCGEAVRHAGLSKKDDSGNIGSIRIDAFSILPSVDGSGEVIGFSNAHFYIRDDGVIKLLNKVRVHEDNSVSVGYFENDPVTSELRFSKEFKCIMNESVYFEKI